MSRADLSTVGRLQGWETRLAHLLREIYAKQYVLGEHDCFSVACQDIKLLTGYDYWPEFRGYKTRREAILKLAAYGSSFEAAGDWFFGHDRLRPHFARRGDICAVQTDDGEKHFGICYGRDIILTAEKGIAKIPLLDALCCWRVG